MWDSRNRFFIFLILPVSLGGYFLLHALTGRFEAIARARLRDIYLCLVSLFFYAFFSWNNLIWITALITVTYLAGLLLTKLRCRKAIAAG